MTPTKEERLRALNAEWYALYARYLSESAVLNVRLEAERVAFLARYRSEWAALDARIRELEPEL